MNRLSACIFALLIAGTTALNYSSNGQVGPDDAAIRRRQAMERGCYSQVGIAANGKQATTVEQLKWPNGVVPYEISKDYSPEQVQKIKEGINMITSQTCIKLVERTSESEYVKIVDGSGCSSLVGKNVHEDNPTQDLTLNKDGCLDPSTVAHEFYHALGMSHEQSRTDRDDYIEVIWNNIKEGNKHNYEIRKASTTFGLPYDFDSAMHYSWNAFAIDESKPTMVSKVPGKEVPKEEGSRLSPLDIQKMKKLYNCP